MRSGESLLGRGGGGLAGLGERLLKFPPKVGSELAGKPMIFQPRCEAGEVAFIAQQAGQFGNVLGP